MENIMEISLLSAYLVKIGNSNLKNTLARPWGQQHYLQEPRNGRNPSACQQTIELKKMWYIYIYTTECYPAIKKNEILTFAAI